MTTVTKNDHGHQTRPRSSKTTRVIKIERCRQKWPRSPEMTMVTKKMSTVKEINSDHLMKQVNVWKSSSQKSIEAVLKFERQIFLFYSSHTHMYVLFWVGQIPYTLSFIAIKREGGRLFLPFTYQLICPAQWRIGKVKTKRRKNTIIPNWYHCFLQDTLQYVNIYILWKYLGVFYFRKQTDRKRGQATIPYHISPQMQKYYSK